MPIEFRFPDVGEGIVEGEIRRWLVKEGDRVKTDQPLVEVETDKALVELPAPKAGTVLKICAREGEIVKVGQLVVVIGEPDELPASPPEPHQGSVTVVGALEETPEELPVPHPPVTPPRPSEEKVRAIPSVRKLAQELEVDLAQIRGSGADGRILREDILRAVKGERVEPPVPVVTEEAPSPASVEPAGSPAPAAEGETVPAQPGTGAEGDEPVERLPLSRLRRTIAAAMVKSAFTAPHVTTHDEVWVSRLMEILRQERARAETHGVHLTVLPFIIKAVIAGLRAESALNAELDIEAGVAILKKYYHIGIATDTPDGLIVPVVRHADRKGIVDLAREITELSEKARNRTAHLNELRGSTFTITNYGALGGLFGTPIINPPEVAVLGLGRVQEKPVVREGQVVIRPVLPLSLSFDHRLIDGATAQRFLNVVMVQLQDPDRLLSL